MAFRDRDFGRGRDRGRGNSRGGFGGGRGFGGNRGSRGGFGGDRGRDRKPLVDVVCDQCGKDCQVPFKPTGDKPVLCSECFEKKGNGRSFGGSKSNNFSSGSGNGISQEQFNELNSKLDRVLEILENIEFEDSEEDEEETEDDEEEVK